MQIVCSEPHKTTAEVTMFYKLIIDQTHTLNKWGCIDFPPAHYWGKWNESDFFTKTGKKKSKYITNLFCLLPFEGIMFIQVDIWFAEHDREYKTSSFLILPCLNCTSWELEEIWKKSICLRSLFLESQFYFLICEFLNTNVMSQVW